MVSVAHPRRRAAGHATTRALEAEGWPVADDKGTCINAALALIDGGYRPDAVGQFCLRRNAGLPRRKWHMIIGKAGRQAPHAIWPKVVQRNRRGHVYREINVDEAKHVLRELLAIPCDRPGGWRTYVDRSLEAYHRHLVSEHFITKPRGGREVKVWEKRPGAGPNHWWDCEVYQVAAAIACGVKLPDRERAATAYAQGVARSVRDYFKTGQRNRTGR